MNMTELREASDIDGEHVCHSFVNDGRVQFWRTARIPFAGKTPDLWRLKNEINRRLCARHFWLATASQQGQRFAWRHRNEPASQINSPTPPRITGGGLRELGFH